MSLLQDILAYDKLNIHSLYQKKTSHVPLPSSTRCECSIKYWLPSGDVLGQKSKLGFDVSFDTKLITSLQALSLILDGFERRNDTV